MIKFKTGGGGGGGGGPPPIFVTSNRGGQIIPTYYYWHPQSFSPSGITVSKEIILKMVEN